MMEMFSIEVAGWGGRLNSINIPLRWSWFSIEGVG
jgi:hypothetical protein